MAKKAPQSLPKGFEDALRELEEILRQIEGGALGLEESLNKYERGNFLIQHCRGILGAAEKQIELISGNAEQGVRVTAIKQSEPPSDEEEVDEPAAEESDR